MSFMAGGTEFTRAHNRVIASLERCATDRSALADAARDQQAFADMVRNRRRTEIGLPPINERWDRSATEFTKRWVQEAACRDCQDTGVIMQDIGTATIPDYIPVACACISDEEPSGTAYDDFHPFNDHKYEGI